MLVTRFEISPVFRVAVAALLCLTPPTLTGQTPSENAKVLNGLVSANLISIRLDIPPEERVNQPDEKPYRVSNGFYLKVTIKNDSDQTIKVRVVDRFYQHRPELVRDGKLVPYRGGLSDMLKKQEADPGFVSLRNVFSVAPYSSEELTEIDLHDWYGDLEPGMYRLIDRYRLDVRGPWTPDSVPLSFEVVPKNQSLSLRYACR